MIPLIDRLASSSRDRAEAAMRTTPLSAIEDLIEKLPPVRPCAARLSGSAGPRPRVIAGMKRTTPGGLTRPEYVPRQIALGFARVGAAAVAVATEPDHFGGDLSHILEVRAAHLPIVMQDYLVTPYQVAEARAAGADAVILIAGMLSGPPLGIMLHAARRYGIEAIVDVHDERQIDEAIEGGASIVAVNQRDPRTLATDPGVAARLRTRIPPGVTAVVRGGIRTPEDLGRLVDAGYEAFLIGEALMRQHDPGDALWRLMQPAA